MKKIFITCLFISIVLCSTNAQKIYDVYTSGAASAGATYASDYIVLSGFTANQSVVGKSVQYRGSGTGWTVISLTGNADALGLYRIWLSASASGAPWTPQLFTGAVSMSNTNSAQLALMSTTTQITASTCPSGGTLHDLVGYIGSTSGTQSTCSETSSAPATDQSGTQTRRRQGGLPGQDTGNNSVDFTVIAASSPLPIELIHFTARQDDNKNILEWATASEINSQNFDIERSGDGITFATIGEVKASGKGDTYSFTDAAPLSGYNYYRLKQVDYDGKSEYSPVRSVKVGSGSSAILSPNPIHQGNNANLIFDSVDENDLTIEVFNTLGQAVLRQETTVSKGINPIQLDILALPKGVYTLLTRVGTQSSESQQFIIQ